MREAARDFRMDARLSKECADDVSVLVWRRGGVGWVKGEEGRDREEMCQVSHELEIDRSYLNTIFISGCSHDTSMSFFPVRVHPGSLFWICIRLHVTNTKCIIRTSHIGGS